MESVDCSGGGGGTATTPARPASEEEELETSDDQKKLWAGRFKQRLSPVIQKFEESVSFDQRLYKQDIRGSVAHARMLALKGLITQTDREMIVKGLEEIEKEIEAGGFNWRESMEDLHMNIEAALIEKIGEPAKKLHTARSRNDQVATDLRLWCRDEADKILSSIKKLQVALFNLANCEENKDLIIPGYTHLQRAQPILLQHLLLAYIEQLERDYGRLSDCKQRFNYCPLGACALAGTGLDIDRHLTSKLLGFKEPIRNSIDAVSDRDFVIEFLSSNAITGVHLSQLGEEWILWASEEFGFLTPSDAVSTGSSMMPQKKNPDPMELVRGKSSRVIGDLMTLLVLCKGMPQAYNRDLQEDKEPLFDSVATITAMLDVTTEFARNVTFNRKRISETLSVGHLDATTLADYLVKEKKIPFRTSHGIVGNCVAYALSKGCQLSKLTLDDLRSISPDFDQDVYEYVGVENAIKKFTSYGSTGKACVQEQMSYWHEKLH